VDDEMRREPLHGRKETKVCDDWQTQERSDGTIRRGREDEKRQASQADEVNVSLTNYLALMPDHPLARGIKQWITSLDKMFADVSWWEIRAGQLAPHTWKACISVQFAGNPTRYKDVFVYTDIEYLKGIDHG